MDAPFLDGMKVGLGYDILTGSANKSAAVKWDSLTAPPEGAGQIVQTTLQIIQETSQLQQSLGITADARAGNLVADVSAKVKFANDIAVNSFCLYVVVGVRVTNTIQTLDNPTLTNDAADLLKNRNLTRFRERFGDRFVSGIKSGGEYYSVYKVQSLDTTERSSVASKIQARAGSPVVGGVSLDVELSTLKSSSKSKLDINVFVYQSGGANIATETTLGKDHGKSACFSDAGRCGASGPLFSATQRLYRTSPAS